MAVVKWTCQGFRKPIKNELIVELQWYATLRPPTLRPVFKEIAEICHHKIFHFKAGFTIKFYFDSKFAIQLFKKARDFQLFFWSIRWCSGWFCSEPCELKFFLFFSQERAICSLRSFSTAIADNPRYESSWQLQIWDFFIIFNKYHRDIQEPRRKTESLIVD